MQAPEPKGFTFYIENTEFKLFSEAFRGGVQKFALDHSHAFYELFFVVRGNLTVVTETESKTLSPGEFIIIPPKMRHRTVYEPGAVALYVLNFSFRKTALLTPSDLFGKLSKTLSSVCMRPVADAALFAALQKCHSYMLLGDRSLVSVAFHEFAVLLYRFTDEDKKDFSPEAPFFDSDAGRIHKINAFIDTRYAENIRIEEIAEALHLSVRQVSRIIRNYYGTTYRELVRQQRMRVAAEALRTTEMTVEEIATLVGYGSFCSFYTAFKQQYGVSPSVFRKP